MSDETEEQHEELWEEFTETLDYDEKRRQFILSDAGVKDAFDDFLMREYREWLAKRNA